MTGPKPVQLRKPDPEVVARLEGLLESARKGELMGFQAFLVLQGATYEFAGAGQLDLGKVLVAIELWKLRELMACEPAD